MKINAKITRNDDSLTAGAAKEKGKASEMTEQEHRIFCTVRGKLFLAKRVLQVLAAVLLSLATANAAFAAGTDPLVAINNLSDLVFQDIKAIGMLILLFGLVQWGLSIQSHDTQQRSQGILCMLGGVIIAFAKEILDMIL